MPRRNYNRPELVKNGPMRGGKLRHNKTDKPDIGVVHTAQEERPGWLCLGYGYKRDIALHE